MEFKRIEQDGEVVLTYCPSCVQNEVELRYEHELPQRMKTELTAEEETADVPEAAERYARRRRRRRRWIIAIVIALVAATAVGGTIMGVWLFQQSQKSFSPTIVPDWNVPENGGGGSQQDKKKDLETDTDIPVYRPVTLKTPRFSVSAVADGTEPLSAGEIYTKVVASTVTILGIEDEGYSVGTGIVFTHDGFIMTNFHVIAGCTACQVWISDEYGVDEVYDARFVGGDAEQDLAVLKIDAKGLTAAEFGVSSDLSVGDKVYAIGNPLGVELRSTFTDGIVSAVDRNVEVDGVTMTLIQTNTALNSGNSGGPLVNQYGQVVGINTIKMMSGYDTIEGLGFAIPSSIAERMINDILQTGKVRPQPLLGVMVNRIPTTLSDGTVGLEVVEVTAGLGAEKAGVQVGDIVVGFNGVPVSRVEHIYAQRHTLSVGDVASIRVFRDGEYLDLAMEMMAEPAK